MNDLRMRVRDQAERDKYVKDMAAVGYSVATESREGSEIELTFAVKPGDEVQDLEVLRPMGLSAAAVNGPSAKFKPFICTPCYGGMLTQQYLAGYSDLVASLERNKVDYVPCIFGGESLITRARNRAVVEFLRTDCTHLLFIDADIGFSAGGVQALLACNEEVVCAPYPLKHHDWAGIAQAAKQGVPPEHLEGHGACYAANLFPSAMEKQGLKSVKRNGHHYVYDAQDVATGFLLIARPALERIIATFRTSIEYECDYWPNQGEIHWNIFDARIDPTSPRQKAAYALLEAVRAGKDVLSGGSLAQAFLDAFEQPPGRYLSEDYTFSRYHQMCGGKIWMCLDVRLTHTGAATYKGSMDNVFRIAKPVAKKAAE